MLLSSFTNTKTPNSCFVYHPFLVLIVISASFAKRIQKVLFLFLFFYRTNMPEETHHLTVGAWIMNFPPVHSEPHEKRQNGTPEQLLQLREEGQLHIWFGWFLYFPSETFDVAEIWQIKDFINNVWVWGQEAKMDDIVLFLPVLKSF